MKVQSYCFECRRVRDFTITQNIGPALVGDYHRTVQRLYTIETAPGYEVRGLCSVEHRDEDGNLLDKRMVIPRWRREKL